MHLSAAILICWRINIWRIINQSFGRSTHPTMTITKTPYNNNQSRVWIHLNKFSVGLKVNYFFFFIRVKIFKLDLVKFSKSKGDSLQ